MSTTQAPTTLDTGNGRYPTHITADADLPVVRIRREFDATPDQLRRAHTDRDLVVQWLGPRGYEMEVDTWDCRTSGSYRYIHRDGDEEHAFRGCFHEVSDTRLVQTFTYEGMPESVSLELMTFEDLGDGRSRLEAVSIVDSFEARDQMLASGMEVGVNQGYERIEELLEAGTL